MARIVGHSGRGVVVETIGQVRAIRGSNRASWRAGGAARGAGGAARDPKG